MKINSKLVLDKSIPYGSMDKLPMWEYDIVFSDYIEELKERKKKQEQDEKDKAKHKPNKLKQPKFKQPKFRYK